MTLSLIRIVLLIAALSVAGCSDSDDPAGSGGTGGGGTPDPIVDTSGNPVIGGGASADFLGQWVAEADLLLYMNPNPGTSGPCRGFLVLTPMAGGAKRLNLRVYAIDVLGGVSEYFDGYQTGEPMLKVGQLQPTGQVSIDDQTKDQIVSVQFTPLASDRLEVEEVLLLAKPAPNNQALRRMTLKRLNTEDFNALIADADACLN